jgi:hypothetical protein
VKPVEAETHVGRSRGIAAFATVVALLAARLALSHAVEGL